jgi:hypothetical protein
MTKQEIINKFQLYIDDTSELSSQESSDLFDKIYNRVCSDRPWEFTKKAFTSTTSTSVPYISLPSDFAFLTQNNNAKEIDTYADSPVVFVGTNLRPYKVVSFSDRRSYRDRSDVCYIDIVNSRLVFIVQPTEAETVEFDYCSVPASLVLNGSPVFPARFHDIIYHGMCVDSFIIQQSDKAKSYLAENQAFYNKILGDMVYWNSNLQQLS